ncbi:hypothetical protein [Pseudolysinimonas sp.]
MTNYPFDFVLGATAALRERSDLGADSLEAALAQHDVWQTYLHEAKVGLTAWDADFAGHFKPIIVVLEARIHKLEHELRTQRGCTCKCAVSGHSSYGCEGEDFNGPMGYCECSWTGLSPRSVSLPAPVPSRATVEETIARAMGRA